jgi:hypothetical protein
MRVWSTVAAASALALAGSAMADTTFFGEDLTPGGTLAGMVNSQAARASFLSGLVGVGTETFEGFSAGTTPPINLPFAGAGSATLNGSAFVQNLTGAGRFATSGSNWVESDAGGDFSISFSNVGGIAAFGFYGTDLGDFGNQLTLRFTRLDNTTYDVLVPNSINTDGTGIFFGFIASAANVFKNVEFLNNPGGVDVFGFDDMTIGSLQQVVPLPPAAWAGLATLTGVAGIGYIRRRRSN